MDRGAWRATVHGVAKSQTRLKWLSACAHTHTHNMKCASHLEICFVFIPNCPEGSTKRASMHLGVRQVCVLSRVKCGLTPLNLDLRQSFMFSSSQVPAVQIEMVSVSEYWCGKDLVSFSACPVFRSLSFDFGEIRRDQWPRNTHATAAEGFHCQKPPRWGGVESCGKLYRQCSPMQVVLLSAWENSLPQ